MAKKNDGPMVIDVDTTDAVQQSPVEAGEYKVMVLDAKYKEGTSAKGNAWKAISLFLDIPDELNAKEFNCTVFLPNSSGTEKQRARQLGDFKVFKKAFGFGDAESFTAEDLIGREAYAYVVQRDAGEYGLQNDVKSWSVPAY